MKKSQLLLSSFDAQLTELKIIPKRNNTIISYKLKMYDEDSPRRVTKIMRFEDVAAIAFQMNYFENTIGSEVCGFYEIFQPERKERLLERNFTSRKDNYLFHGDYNYDPDDPHDLLNYRENMERVLRELDDYHLYEQQTMVGSYLILAKRWSIA